jgi:hypothetical protein
LLLQGEATLIVTAKHIFGNLFGSDTLNFNIDEIIADKGGKISSLNNDFILYIPPALLNDERICFSTNLLPERSVSALRGEYLPTGLAYALGPDRMVFKENVELTFYYGDNSRAILSENDLSIVFQENGSWIPLGGELYREEQAIRVLVGRTGKYALVVRNVSELKEQEEISELFFLEQNYPNPFNLETTIRFGLETAGASTFRIINLKGQVIATLMDEYLAAGEHIVTWNGADDTGVAVASGVYLYQIKSESFSSTKKLVLVK